MNEALLQYGALGAITLLCIMAVRTLYNDQVEQTERERARGDRLEDELLKLNETVRNEYIHTITDATRAITDALVAVRRVGHGSDAD